jgi:hypothetical protein
MCDTTNKTFYTYLFEPESGAHTLWRHLSNTVINTEKEPLTQCAGAQI